MLKLEYWNIVLSVSREIDRQSQPLTLTSALSPLKVLVNYYLCVVSHVVYTKQILIVEIGSINRDDGYISRYVCTDKIILHNKWKKLGIEKFVFT